MSVKKTPRQQAEEEVNKKLGKAIASRLLEIRQKQAEIRKLEKEIKKIEDGELIPEEGDDTPFLTLKHKESKHKETPCCPPIYPYINPSKWPTPSVTPKRQDYWISTTPNTTGTISKTSKIISFN